MAPQLSKGITTIAQQESTTTLSASYPTWLAIAAVLAFLAPPAVWLYTEFRSRWRERLKADFELLKLCREAEGAGSSFAELRDKLEQSIAGRSSLFDERKRFDWTYAALGMLAIAGGTASLVYQASWLTPTIRNAIRRRSEVVDRLALPDMTRALMCDRPRVDVAALSTVLRRSMTVSLQYGGDR